MFKNRRKHNYNRYYGRRNSNKFLLVWIILGIPLGIILLEILSGLFLDLTNNEANKSGSQGEASLARAYQLKYLTQDEKPIQGLAGFGELLVKSNLGVGYQLVGGQKKQFFQINDQGFRDKDPVSLAKAKDEIRIFILGNSTAFGQGSKNNEGVISHQLETLLNQRVAQQQKNPTKYRPDIFPFFEPNRVKLLTLPAKIRQGKYRVINAAVPGYISGNELAQLTLEILPYQPDIIIVLDGYMDLVSSSEKQANSIPQQDYFLQDAQGHFTSYLNQSFSQWLQERALYKTIAHFFWQQKGTLTETTLLSTPLDKYLPANKEELQKRVKRYESNYQQMVKLASSMGIPLVLVIQPEITGIPDDKLAAEERKIRDNLGKKYLESMPKAYGSLIQSAKQLEKKFPTKVKVLNFYNWNENIKQPIFNDAIHLTEQGNKAIASQMYNAITSLEEIHIIPDNFYIKEQSNGKAKKGN
jgi:hypothetical protein